jgi:hypothetical protein
VLILPKDNAHKKDGLKIAITFLKEIKSLGVEYSPKERVATAQVAYCEVARRLLDAFGEAVQELVQLHEHQFLAIVDGESDCTRFDALIHMANERKYEAKYSYLRHLEAHGCSTH